MVIKNEVFIKITDSFINMFNLIYYLLNKHSLLVNNKFDNLLLYITPEQIKLLNLSDVDDIYISPIMNKLSPKTQDIIKSLTIKLIPNVQLSNASIIWKIAKRSKFSYACIAINNTGQYLTICDYNLIYTSSNYGESWSEYEYPKNTIMNMLLSNVFISITSDETGKYLVACTERQIYLSSNSGISWELSSAPSTNIIWKYITSNNTCKYLAACAYPSYIDDNTTVSQGGVYTSQDFGITWNLTSLPTDIYFNCIKSNITGSHLFVGGQSSYISSDYGKTWTEISYLKEKIDITSVAINNDGSVLIGTSNSGLYLYSNSIWKIVLNDIKFSGILILFNS
jgi:hypothetical protein